MLLVFNKWDLIEKDNYTLKNIKDDIIETFPALSYFPMIFISVKNNLRVREILKYSKEVYYEREKEQLRQMI